jgi:hypothetical protein
LLCFRDIDDLDESEEDELEDVELELDDLDDLSEDSETERLSSSRESWSISESFVILSLSWESG